MNTEVKTTITARLDEVALFYWDPEIEEAIDVDGRNLREMAAEFKCSPELLEALVNFVDYLKDMLGADLRDIWEKLEAKR